MTWRYVEARDLDAPLLYRLASVWRHRRLLQRMAKRELRQRHAGSALGFTWAILHPLIFVGAYALIFTFVFGGRLSEGAPPAQYALYVVSGLLPWMAFSEVAGKATQSMVEHRNLVKFAVFPVQILPLATLYAVAVTQLIGLAAVLVLKMWVSGGLDAAVLLLPPALLLQGVFLAGAAWLLGAVGTRFRDAKELVQLALMVGMFLTPIFYLEDSVPRPLRLLVTLNPLAHLVNLYRDALLGLGVRHPASFVVFALVAALTLVCGFALFDRARAYMSDIL
jgi:lipopolysaccharide transport system permease protein